MKKILLLMIIAAVFVSCTKPKKTRSGPDYWCYLYELYGGDTILRQSTPFYYSQYTAQQQQDTLRHYNTSPNVLIVCQ